MATIKIVDTKILSDQFYTLKKVTFDKTRKSGNAGPGSV
jgi:hypothetical protein